MTYIQPIAVRHPLAALVHSTKRAAQCEEQVAHRVGAHIEQSYARAIVHLARIVGRDWVRQFVQCDIRSIGAERTCGMQTPCHAMTSDLCGAAPYRKLSHANALYEAHSFFEPLSHLGGTMASRLWPTGHQEARAVVQNHAANVPGRSRPI